MKSSEAMIFAVMRSPEFFRLLYAIAKIALITAKIIASLDLFSLFTSSTSSHPEKALTIATS